MKTNHLERMTSRISELVARGEEVVATTRTVRTVGTRITQEAVDASLFDQWRTSSLSALISIFGESSVYVTSFRDRCRTSHSPFYARGGLAVLKAAEEDLQGGYLKDLKSLVSADVFSDFLGMAEHLLYEGFEDPAAVLTGAVLEDGLRRIAEGVGKTGKDIKTLNDRLAQDGVYNRLTQKQVGVWNDIRNHAAHGNFDEYTEEDVRGMLTGVVSFLERHL